jgi:hypothetical protein
VASIVAEAMKENGQHLIDWSIILTEILHNAFQTKSNAFPTKM